MLNIFLFNFCFIHLQSINLIKFIMKHIEKTRGYYDFTTDCPLNGNDVNVTISLVINYSLNTFSILTNKGNNFIFLNGNEDNYVLWLTISDLIKAATEFAVDELSKNKIQD